MVGREAGLVLDVDPCLNRNPMEPSPMTPSRLALVTAVALLSSQLIGAQTPPSAALIRDVAGSQFVLVARADGSVVGWGHDPDGPGSRPAPVVIDLPGKAMRVAVGDSSAYALLEDGTVVAWGANDEGQLGNGARGANGVLGVYPKPSVTPVRVTDLADIIAVEAGSKHALALRKDGTVWAWGRRDDGALGGGDAKPAGSLRVTSALAPVAVPGLEGITQIAAGRTHNLALRRDGHVMSWGANSTGELGVGTRVTGWTPAQVIGLDRVVEIAAGYESTGISGAIRDDGTVWIWGSNGTAAMGNGQKAGSPDEPGGSNPLPVQVKGIVGAKHLSIGSGHVAALLGDGSLRMWGKNCCGEIGIGTSGPYEPRPVTVAGIANVAAVYLGNLRSYMVRADGTLWVSGSSHYPAQGILAKNLLVPTRLDLPGPAIAGQPKPASLPAVNSVLGGSYPVDRLDGILQFTLDSVAVASRFATAQQNLVAGPGKRLLILTGSLTNVQTYDYPIGGDMVAFNVRSETGERTVNSGGNSFALPGLMPLSGNLKPKETVRFVTVMEIYPAGPIARLAAFRATGGRIAWYDIQKDLGRMQSVFSDGLDLGARAEARIGSAFDFGAFDMVVESAGPVSSAGAYRSSASTQTYAVTVKVTNALRAPASFGWQYATPTLVDADGRQIGWKSDVIDSATGKSAGPELAPGTPYRLQYVFDAEPGRKLKEFTLASSGGRTIVVDAR
jgi:alpha-tubulin suppressor-like RCC1 family protein